MKTTRLATAQKQGVDYLKQLLKDNLEEVYRIIVWNASEGIRLFRVPSDLAPHITNPALILDKNNWKSLAYSFYDMLHYFRKIGDFAKQKNIRLTFHSSPYVVISSPDPEKVRRSLREIYLHILFLEYFGLDENSIIILHGGGTYGNKAEASARWVKVYNQMPEYMQRRLALENDETEYSLDDVLAISHQTGVPIVLDIFHYQCYETWAKKKGLKAQSPLEKLLPAIIATWGKRAVKMHISQQKKGAHFGAHADYVDKIPELIKTIPQKYHCDLDLMIEANKKEKAVLQLFPAPKSNPED